MDRVVRLRFGEGCGGLFFGIILFRHRRHRRVRALLIGGIRF